MPPLSSLLTALGCTSEYHRIEISSAIYQDRMTAQSSRTKTSAPSSERRERRRAASHSLSQVAPSARERKRSATAPASKNEKARKIFKLLRLAYPDAAIELNYSNPVELLIATILSAQCTDVKVNEVTAELFRELKRPQDYLNVPQATLEAMIRPTGFFKQKAKNIRAAMKILLERHSGKVPRTMDELVQLPGVGRKTANVVLGNAFDLPGLPVDTHVRRIANRLGLTNNDDPVKIEADLCALLPPEDWCMFSHTLIFHGRRTCKARKPNCAGCTVFELCDHPHDGAPAAPRASHAPREKSQSPSRAKSKKA